MSHALLSRPHPGDWTYADLMALPETGPKSEIVEGNLIVSPSPTNQHQFAIMQLLRLLDDAAPAGPLVLFDLDVDLGRNVFRPDILVLTAAAAERDRPYGAADLLLAVEVTSPSSRSMDRIIKPAALAAAGVPGYWRADIEGDPFIEIYEVDAGAYKLAATARAGTPLQMQRPFPVEIDAARLVR